MPALFPLRLALTKEQSEWLDKRSRTLGKPSAQIVSELLETEICGENTSGRLAELTRMVGESNARSHRLEKVMVMQHEVSQSYLKEIFRESSANLYRLEAIVADMDDPVSVRMLMNEYVRGLQRRMEEQVKIFELQLK